MLLSAPESLHKCPEERLLPFLKGSSSMDLKRERRTLRHPKEWMRLGVAAVDKLAKDKRGARAHPIAGFSPLVDRLKMRV
jgi:hypothetical protein